MVLPSAERCCRPPPASEPDRPSRREWLASAPSLGWLILLFLIPTLLVFAVSFRPSTPTGGVGEGWTLTTWFHLRNPSYPAILLEPGGGRDARIWGRVVLQQREL